MEKRMKIVYSLKVFTGLVERGFYPVQTLPNPKNTKFNCWVFEETEELRQVLDSIFGE